MTHKFQNRYRVPSARLPKWDYRWAGAYFITICTKNRERYFGNIHNGTMQLSGTGIVADVLLYEIQNHTRNVELGEFVVMPNHVHLILILNGINGVAGGVDDAIAATSDADGAAAVQTLHATSLQPPPPPQKNETMANRSPRSGSVSTIIRSYKSAVTKHAHRLGFAFGWQERFYDHLIRDEKEYQRIVEYIRNNPKKWEMDKFF